MQHHFDTDLACKYGVLESILINHFEFWIEQNEKNKRNYYDGRYWTYNSMRAFAQIFPYVSERRIRNALKHLEEEGVLVTGNYNKSSYDRTLWYAFSDFGKSILQKCQMDKEEMSNGSCGKVRPIPDNNQIHKPDDLPDNSFGEESQKQARQKIDYVFIMKYFNENCTGFPSIREMTERRKKAIRSFLRDHTEADLFQLFTMAQQSDFLTGSNKNGWRADFDWILKSANAVKILEGNYQNRKNENEPDFSKMPKGYKGLYEFMKEELEDDPEGIF